MTYRYEAVLRRTQDSTPPIGFSDGRHGYVLSAPTMSDAIEAVFARADVDGTTEGWIASISPLSPTGQTVRFRAVCCPMLDLGQRAVIQSAATAFLAPCEAWAIDMLRDRAAA